MKEEISIPLGKEEDSMAASKRRYTYSLKRDLQASEFNEAISLRLLAEARNVAKGTDDNPELLSGSKSK